jgi:YHS domain-containing protein
MNTIEREPLMHRTTLIFLSLIAALCLAGLAPAQDKPAATQPIFATDLGNTVCPISGDPVGDSKLVEVYDGKVYHLCCPSCRDDFEKDPAKVARAVAADPAKFGIK